MQDRERALELWKQATRLKSSQAHYNLAVNHRRGGDSKKAEFHYEPAAMAGHEVARFNLGCMEAQSRNMDRSVKHSIIATLVGHCGAMNTC